MPLCERKENNMKRITTLEQLFLARANRLSVIVPRSISYNYPMPAAFAINMSGYILHRLMHDGMYVYKAKKRTYWKKEIGNVK